MIGNTIKSHEVKYPSDHTPSETIEDLTEKQQDGEETHQYGDAEQLKSVLQESLILFEKCNGIDFKCNKGLVTIGYTGAGKSTLVRLLSGKTLKVHQRSPCNFRLSYMIPDDQGKFAELRTDIPARFNVSGTVLWDMPGFKDSRSLAYSIMSAYYTSKIIKQAMLIRFLLVVGTDDLDHSRGISVINIMKQLFYMVKKPLSIIDHTILVITKNVWLVEDSGVRELLKSSLSENTKNFTEEEIEFFNEFSEKVRVVFFNLPNSYGMTKGDEVNVENDEKIRKVKSSIMSKMKFAEDVDVNIPRNITEFRDSVKDVLRIKNEENREKMQNVLRKICSIESGNDTKRCQMIWILQNLFKSFEQKHDVATFFPLHSLADALVCVGAFSMEERDAMRKRTEDIALLFKLGSAVFKTIVEDEKWDRTLSDYNLSKVVNDANKDTSITTSFSFFITKLFKKIYHGSSRTLSKMIWTSDKHDSSEHYYYTRIKPTIHPVDIYDLNVDNLRKKFPFLEDVSDKYVLLPEK